MTKVSKREADLSRMIELYQKGAVIEYHRFDNEEPKRFHVGFRYDCMSDDEYFELRDLERKYKIKEDANLRGDPSKTRHGKAMIDNLGVGESLAMKSAEKLVGIES